MAIDVSHIEGKAWVMHAHSMTKAHREAWLLHEDHFYVKHCLDMHSPDLANLRSLPSSKFHSCSSCLKAHQESLTSSIDGHHKLQGLELFAGAGGLSAGMDQSGFVETQWIVEWTTSATLTYQYVFYLCTQFIADLLFFQKSKSPYSNCL